MHMDATGRSVKPKCGNKGRADHGHKPEDLGGGKESGLAPKTLLAREMQATIRREERAEAARKAQENELRLATSFRATEVSASKMYAVLSDVVPCFARNSAGCRRQTGVTWSVTDDGRTGTCCNRLTQRAERDLLSVIASR